ncbi:MAG: hypothetical protein ACREQQ_16920 [Candidatus Binatia bacterium]
MVAARIASGPSFRFGAKFSPHILVFLLTLLAAIPPLRGTIVAVVNLWWGKSYAKVDFVMDEARPNDGYPYITGHFEGSTEPRGVVGLMQGTTMVVKGAPSEAFEPGKRIAVWHSPDAPNFVVFGAEINDVPVASLPERPGWTSLLLHLVWLYLTFVVGLRATAWVAKRWSRTFGNLPMDRRSRSRLGG